MTGTWLGLVAGIAIGTALYRFVGWIRFEETGAEITKKALRSLTPRYKQTQPANPWKLRMRRPVVRRKSA